jgi:hypothetical protein
VPRVLFLLALVVVPSLAAADQVTVKGTVLEGKVKKISAKEIVMETVYGKGDLTIPTAAVSAIATDAPFHVFQADDGVAVGEVVGITPAAVTIAEETGGKEIPFTNVQAAPRDAGPDANWFERLPMESPWWGGSLDLAFSSVEATTHTIAFAGGFEVDRKRGPDRTRFGGSYLRGSTSKDKDDPDTDQNESITHTTANEVGGFLRHEHDLTARIFGFGSLEAEHDGVEEVALRLIPKVGAGYRIVKTEDALFSVDAGVAWVSQRYFSSNDDKFDSFLALAFGAESNVKLPWLKSTWHTRADYLPSITHWVTDYRLRGETSLLVPIVERLSFKAALIDEYNSVPASDAVPNSFATLLGLTLVY